MKKTFTLPFGSFVQAFVAAMIFLLWTVSVQAQVISDGLVGYWPLDGNALDLSNSLFHGTQNGGVYVEDRNGNPGKALSFSSSNDQILIDHTIDLTGPSAFSFWFKVNNPKYAHTFISNYTHCSYSDDGVNLGLYNGGNPRMDLLFDQNPSAGRVTHHTNYETGDWYNVVVNFTVDSAYLYVNGELVGVDDQTYISSTQKFRFGNTLKEYATCALGEPLNLNGVLDEVYFFNRTLTASEIFQISKDPQPITWHPAHFINATTSGNDIVAGISPIINANGGYSSDVLPANTDGWVSFEVNGTTTAGATVGLTENDGFNTIPSPEIFDYSIDFLNNEIRPREGNTLHASIGTAGPNDVLSIGREGTSMVIRQNGTLIYTFTGTLDASLELLATVSIRQPGDQVSQVVSSSTFTQNTPSIEGDESTGQPILWNTNELYNITISGNDLVGGTGQGSNQSGAISQEFLSANADGWVSYEVGADHPVSIALGLSGNVPTNYSANIWSIDYGAQLDNKRIKVIQNGAIGIVAYTEVGDVVKVERLGAEVLIKKNGYVLYRFDNVDASQELVAHASIPTEGHILRNVKASESFELPSQPVTWNQASFANVIDNAGVLEADVSPQYGIYSQAISLEKTSLNQDFSVVIDITNTKQAHLGLTSSSSVVLSNTQSYLNFRDSDVIYTSSTANQNLGAFQAGDQFELAYEHSTTAYKVYKNGTELFSEVAPEVPNEWYVFGTFLQSDSKLDPVGYKGSYTKDADPDLQNNTLGSMIPSWDGTLSQNVDIQPTTIIYNNYIAAWQGRAYTDNVLPSNTDGWIQAKATAANSFVAFGLSRTNETSSIPTYSWYLKNKELYVRELGTLTPILGLYDENDVLQVERSGNQILYKKNDFVIYITDNVDAIEVLDGRVSFYGANNELKDVLASENMEAPGVLVEWNPVTMANTEAVDDGGIAKLRRLQNPSDWEAGAISLDYIPALEDGWIEYEYLTPDEVFIGLDNGSALNFNGVHYNLHLKGTTIEPQIIYQDQGVLTGFDNQIGDKYRFHRKAGPGEWSGFGEIEVYQIRNGQSTLIYTFTNIPNSNKYHANAQIRLDGGSVCNTKIYADATKDNPPAQSASALSEVDVIWDNTIIVNATVDPVANSIKKTGGANDTYDVTLLSAQKLPANTDGWVEFTVKQSSINTNHGTYFGLSPYNTSTSAADVKYAIQNVNKRAAIFLNGVEERFTIRRVDGDVLRIERAGTYMIFYRNGYEFWKIQNVDASEELYVDLAMYKLDAEHFDVKVSESFVTPNQSVSWHPFSLYNATNNISGSGEKLAWLGDPSLSIAGGYSIEYLPANTYGSFEVTVTDLNSKDIGFAEIDAGGIDTDNERVGSSLIDYHFRIDAIGQLQCYNLTTSLLATPIALNVGDKLKIEKFDNNGTPEIRFYHQPIAGTETLIHTINTMVDANQALLVDAHLYHANAEWDQALISGDVIQQEVKRVPELPETKRITWNEGSFSNLQFDESTYTIMQMGNDGSSGSASAVSADFLPANTDGFIEVEVASKDFRTMSFGLIAEGNSMYRQGNLELPEKLPLMYLNFGVSLVGSNRVPYSHADEFGYWNAGDKFRVGRREGKLYYAKNGVIFYELQDDVNHLKLYATIKILETEPGAGFSNINGSTTFEPSELEQGDQSASTGVEVNWDERTAKCVEIQNDNSVNNLLGETGQITAMQTLAPNTNGWVEFEVNDINQAGTIALSHSRYDVSVSNLARVLIYSQFINVYHLDNSWDRQVTRAAGGVFRIERFGDQILYKRNGSTLYQASVDPNQEMYVMVLPLNDSPMPTVEVSPSFSGSTLTSETANSHLGQTPNWDAASAQNLSLTGNTITVNNGVSNASLNSETFLAANENGWVEVSTPSISGSFYLGLATPNATSYQSDITYRIGFFSGTLRVWYGSTMGEAWSYGCNDVLRIERDGDQIKFKKNNYVLESITVDPSEVLIIDTYFQTADLVLDDQIKCLNASGTKPVTWHPFYNVNTRVEEVAEGTRLSWLGDPTHWHTANIRSIEFLEAGLDGFLEVQLYENASKKTLGLAKLSDRSQEYQFYINNDGQLSCRYNGNNLPLIETTETTIASSIGDVLKLEKNGSTFNFYLNEQLICTQDNTGFEEDYVVDVWFDRGYDPSWTNVQVSENFQEQEINYVDPEVPVKEVTWNFGINANTVFDETEDMLTLGPLEFNQFSSAFSLDYLPAGVDGFFEFTLPYALHNFVQANFVTHNEMYSRAQGSPQADVPLMYCHGGPLRTLNPSESFGVFNMGDTFRIGRKNGVIYHARNGVIYHQMEGDFNYDLYVQFMLNNIPDVRHIRLSSGFLTKSVDPFEPLQTEGQEVVWDQRRVSCVNELEGVQLGTSPGKPGGAVSLNRLPANTDGWMQFTLHEGFKFNNIGLSKEPAFNEVRDQYRILEGGSNRFYIYFRHNWRRMVELQPYDAGNTYKMERKGNEVIFRRNGHFVYKETVDPTEELFVFAQGHLNTPEIIVSESFVIESTIKSTQNNSIFGAAPIWQSAQIDDVTITGDTIITVDQDNASMATSNTFEAKEDGWVEILKAKDATGTHFGLALANVTANASDINYRIHLKGSEADLYHNNTLLSSWPYGCDDKFRVERVKDQVIFKKNELELETLTVSTSEVLIGDFFFETAGITLVNSVKIHNHSEAVKGQHAVLRSKLSAECFDVPDDEFRFYVRDKHFPSNINFTIYDQTRNAVLTGSPSRSNTNLYSVDVTGLAQGIYFIEVEQTNGVVVKARFRI